MASSYGGPLLTVLATVHIRNWAAVEHFYSDLGGKKQRRTLTIETSMVSFIIPQVAWKLIHYIFIKSRAIFELEMLHKVQVLCAQ